MAICQCFLLTLGVEENFAVRIGGDNGKKAGNLAILTEIKTFTSLQM